MKYTDERLIDVYIREGARAYQPRMWKPAADVWQADRSFMIKIELAGVTQSDIQLIALGQKLCVRGLRRDLSMQGLFEHKEHLVQSMEIAYNRFERLFDIPFDVEKSDVNTEYQDGMLTIYLKEEESLL